MRHVHSVVSASYTDRQATLLVRLNGRTLQDSAWKVRPVTLEELVLGYMAGLTADGPAVPAASRRRGGVGVIAVALRQHRIQLAAGLGVMVVLAALLVGTGDQMTSYLHSTGLAACLAAHGGGCDAFSHLFENRYGGLLRNIAYLNFLPMLVGVFWGAPLVARELETGTYRLAWTQSITRRRWLTGKLALFVLATVAIAAGFSLLLAWWLRPFAQLQFGGGYSRMDQDAFDFQGTVPIAYSLFAFAVGAAAGAVARRVLPAMAITFAICLPLRVWVQSLRASFAKPLEIR